MKKLTPDEHHRLSTLENLIGYTFIQPHLGVHALTIPNEKNKVTNENYQYLEFYGDRIYNLCACISIEKSFKPVKPGKLHAAAHAKLSNAFLTGVALRLGIEDLLLCGGKPAELLENQTKRLADILEAIYGAVFIDSSCDFSTAFKVHKRILQRTVVEKKLPQATETAAP